MRGYCKSSKQEEDRSFWGLSRNYRWPCPFADACWCFHSAVVVLAGALLKQCLNLLGKGVHPTTISEALHKASEKAVEVRLGT